MRIYLILIALLTSTLAFAQKKKSAYAEGLYAEVNTTKGLIVIQLEFEKTPMTVANFVGLAEGTINNEALPPGKPYFDGSRWHRVVPGHVIQCGMPANSTAEGPGYAYPNEIVKDLNHSQAGMVGIANGGPHTNGSQWYITLGDRSYLDGDYTVFGHVIKGLEILPSITQDDAIKTLKIVRVGKAAEAFRPTTQSFNAMVEEQKNVVLRHEQQRGEEEASFIRERWPNATPYIQMVVLAGGEGPRPKSGDKLMLRYKGQIPGGDSFISTADGKPWYGTDPETFAFVIGTSTINAGFDAGVSRMRVGEKRVLIVPNEQAYGAGGYYPPERKGEKRFHVGPYKTIVYEVERVPAN